VNAYVSNLLIVVSIYVIFILIIGTRRNGQIKVPLLNQENGKLKNMKFWYIYICTQGNIKANHHIFKRT